MTSRTIAALRRLAERPGTEHEGKVARAMLEKARGAAPVEGDISEAFRLYLRREMSIDDFMEAVEKYSVECAAAVVRK